MSRCGASKDHCCWLGKIGECQYVIKSEVNDFNWACLLRQELDSWEAVYRSTRYKENIQPFWNDYPIKGLRCGDWPFKGSKCNDCGEINNG